MSKLKEKRLFLLDMDGTIYLDNELFDGTKEFLDYVKSAGGKYIFLTNNSSNGVCKYIDKLNRMGIKSTAEEFMTSVDATVLYLKNKNYNKVYVFGTASFKEQLTEAGIPITDKLCDDVDCLCMGFDTELTFQKLEDACILLGRGVDYIATNPDCVCPTRYGYVPDCGSISEILYTATGRRPIFIGKPQPEMALLAMEKTGYKKDETVIIGDRLYTDIACGVNAGISSIFVLSGEGTLEEMEKSMTKPDFVYKNIRKIYEDLAN